MSKFIQRAIAIYVLLVPGLLFSQYMDRSHGNADIESAAGSAVLMKGVLAMSGNPSGVAFSRNLEMAAGYKSLFLGIDNISQIYLSSSMSIVENGGIGVELRRLGNSTYSEYQGSLVYAHQLGSKSSLGLGIHGNRTGIEGYETVQGLTISLGFNSEVYENLRIGSTLFGPYYIGKGMQGHASSSLSIQGMYSFSDRVHMHLNIQKDWHAGIGIMTGIHYEIPNAVYIQIGAGIKPNNVAIGVGVPIGKVTTMVASRYHPILGFSPSGHLMYNNQMP